jgi:hypothetical protein
MNVEIGTEATQFLFWEYINGISLQCRDLQVTTFFGYQEPTHLVVFDIAFKTDTYFDGALGVLKKVNNSFLLSINQMIK